MNFRFLFIILFISIIFCSAQNKNECYRIFSDSVSGTELYGYKTHKNVIKIPAKFISTYSDKLCKMAIVLDSKEGWIGIDKKGTIILRPYIYDNGPDYVEEGLFRFTEGKKIGFANLNGVKIITAQFDFVTPFKDGLAEYYIGGERIYENGKTAAQIDKDGGSLEDLHWSWGGNVTEYGYINKSGQRFKEIISLKKGVRQAITFQNKKILLDKKGQVINKY
ncbi:WG repeat-containing protein [Elizabethkingia anophelis]|uniref:WG repeat-containing protein n=1 Tax=Elizabethkingia anophelis TaxID=1117645 RepID=UPI0012B310BE|nr:WG repeat-containing protein [Elizabethkingia anophelis]MDV3746717.1 hypothetical protein [Elizabethkingia anophelis]QGN24132.1 WG repeat-containing protein [Elizabethkingia anophelis]QNV10773.1 WG repeat-containing protein [Elizabethkingia anophelis]UTF88930.1 WG repeat-containing protein [Elizabethkingia anophelis]UTF99852.1 WG repeat-containing protein [Elizabethkingia anophelis]